MDTDLLTHAEVYSDGAVFYIGASADRPKQLFVQEAHNLARKLPAERAEDRVAILDLIEATFSDTRRWRLVDLATWNDEDTYSHYEADYASLVRVYEYIPSKWSAS